MKIEDIRSSFRPAEIRVLFVGESAPQSGKFFYKGNSQVYGYMEKYLGQKLFQTHNNFLENFKAAGYYFDDLVLTPVNKAPRNEQKRLRIQAVPSLAKRIKDYNPIVVVALLKRIEENVRKAVLLSGVDACFCATHFPGNGQQRKFECDIEQILPKLKET